MASDSDVLRTQLLLPYTFHNLFLLRNALTSGDSNSDDREGHRRMAQIGDALIGFVVLSEGFDRGVSRKEQQDICSMLKSKEQCSILARAHGLDQMIKISERQGNIGPQPTVLKNTVAAIVAAVWLDSRDYRVTVEVMASLGLINYAEPLSGMPNLTYAGSMLSSSTAIWNPADELQSPSFITSGSSSEGLGFTDTLTSEEMLMVTNSHQSGNPFAIDLLQDHNMASGLSRYTVCDEGNLGEHEDHNRTTAAGSLIPPIGYMQRQSVVDGHEATTTYSEKAIVGSTYWNVTGNSIDSMTSIFPEVPEEYSTTTRSSGQENCVHQIFQDYITREAGKLQQKPDVFKEHYSHMERYQKALASIDATQDKVKAIAALALAIGDSSAMVSLRQAIRSVRSPTVDCWLRIGRDMFLEQRLEAIYHLDLRMAHLKIARWLHIYKLYERLSDDVGGKDADNFVVCTNAGRNQNSEECHTSVRRGNPHNIQKAMITRRIAEHVSAATGSNRDQEKRLRSLKRLRCIGERLQLLVNRWGLETLCVLGSGFTDDQMLKPHDATFRQLIDVVDRFEGQKIRELASSAACAVHLFMDDSVDGRKLRIEDVHEEFLEKLPRLSQDMRYLFTTTSGGID